MRRSPLVVLPISVLLLTLACSGGGGSSKEQSPTPSPTTAPLTVEQLAHAVVQIQALDGAGDPVWTGSGTFVSKEGLILTNGHVVDNRSDEYQSLGVATTIASDEPPKLSYLADIVAVDYALDLAVIRVATDIDGNKVTDEFPFVPVGDSETVGIGDNIRILGYPGIGGETITFTNGVVSGFTSERSVGGRAWIKTDATIAGGNSGGLALDARGELIGVPTIVGTGANQQTVDCRNITDTNRDGVVDSNDNCVPVGGFLNGLRPVNLAAPLIDAAVTGKQYVSTIEPEPAPTGGFKTGNITISDMTFADGVTDDDRPTDKLDAIPSGATRVCGFWNYEGMSDGMSWEALWFVDGKLSEEGSIVNDTWVGGESGNWWACIIDENGLADGLYELIVSVEGDLRGSRALHVGGDHPPVSFKVDNTSDTPICYVFISPTGAQNWGFDYLGVDESITPGDNKTLNIPGGTYDLLIRDCDEKDLIDERSLDIAEDSVYTVRNQP